MGVVDFNLIHNNILGITKMDLMIFSSKLILTIIKNYKINVVSYIRNLVLIVVKTVIGIER